MSAEKHIIDLGLTLGYSENCTRINAGAGANAGSSLVNMYFPESMAELVWSPRRGPTEKGTQLCFPEKRPLHMWNVEESNGEPSSFQVIRCKENDGGDDDKIVADGKDQMALSETAQNEIEVRYFDKQDHASEFPSEFPVSDTACGLTQFSFERFRDSSMNHKKEIPSDHIRALNEAFVDSLAQDKSYLVEKPRSSSVVLSRYPGTEEEKDANEEDSSENNPTHIPMKDAQKKEERVVRSMSVPLGSHSHRLKKGKNRALSEGDVNKTRFLDGEDNDSQGSVESCHSACMLAKRTWNSPDEIVLESKRMKTGVDDSFASTSMIKRDNSFMTYLSNLVKGSSKVGDDKVPSYDITLPQSSHEDVSRKNKGFQTVFQSLYCPSTKLPEAGTSERQSGKLDKQEDVVGQPEFILSKHSPIKDDVKTNPAENTESRDQEGVMYKNGCRSYVFGANKEVLFHSQMWINRFTTKVCDNSLRGDGVKPDHQTQKSLDFADGEKCPERGSLVGSAKEMDTFASKAESSLGSKNIHGYGSQSAESSHKSRTSEAMASTFARRLDAFKHIVSNETETDQHVQKSTSITKENYVEDEINLNSTSEILSLPLMNLAGSSTADVPSGVFDAVRQLQVSRADMQKWMEDNVSLSKLEGLFLRLRLGKWEEGLGGTGYYVARITAEQSGELSEDGKKSISVNVGDLKYLVGSQYISNAGFLEDEVVVWWRRTLKTGGRVPSREDLDANLRRRIALGL